MIPSVFSAGGGAVASDVTIMTAMQNTHDTNAGCWYVLYGFRNGSRGKAYSVSNAENGKPRAIVVIAAVALARRHNRPSVKMTANGGAMKKNTRCTCTNSGSVCVA